MSKYVVKSSEIQALDAGDLAASIEAIRSQGLPQGFAESSRFDVLVSGSKRLPPKAVIATALSTVLGVPTESLYFSGGEASACNRQLLNHGYPVATKPAQVGLLDASFSVAEDPEGLFLLVESRGPDRNTQYEKGITALLSELRALSVIVKSVEVDSQATADWDRDTRAVEVAGYPYPIALSEHPDVVDIRRSIGRGVAAVRPEGAGGSGNSTKRIRVYFDVPSDFGLLELQSILGGAAAAVTDTSGPFSFTPKPPPKLLDGTPRRAVDSVIVLAKHREIQQALYVSLVSQHGVAAVSCEQRMTSGRPADVVVQLADGVRIYEIKTASTARECIRQALGQLAEYGFWPSSHTCDAVVVVGPAAIDEATSEYLSQLTSKLRLPLSYLSLAPTDGDASPTA